MTDPANKAEVDEGRRRAQARLRPGRLGRRPVPGQGRQPRTAPPPTSRSRTRSARMELTDDTARRSKEAGDEAQDAGLTVEIGGDALQADARDRRRPRSSASRSPRSSWSSPSARWSPPGCRCSPRSSASASASPPSPRSPNVLDLSTTTATLAMMLGLAVGIDYALFIVSRYRAELAEGREHEEAAGRAVGTAGSAVVFAGLTVVIALVGLAVVGIPMLTKMGFAAAGTVVDRRPHRADPGPGAARLRGRAGARAARPRMAAARGEAERPTARSPTWAPAGPGSCCAARCAVLLARRASASAPSPCPPLAGAGPAGRRLAAGQHHPAQGVRPALRRLRARASTAADGRRRRQGRDDPRPPPARSPRRSRASTASRPSPRPRFNKAGDTAMITVVPKDRPTASRPRTWSAASGTSGPVESDTGATSRSPAPPR